MQAAETPASPLPTAAVFSTHPALPRGPPRKPRKSGHALWVGNLPPWTNVIELKDHFSRGATNEIESVFHISKSSCAFINYKTDAACNEAMARFHDNRFKGVRLVCRLRRNSAVTSSPSGAITNDDRPAAVEGTVDQDTQSGGQSNTGTEGIDGVGVHVGDAREKHKDRIFILKSLTVEDLDLSVMNGVWATQSHNEDMLNRAFETSENVYLIFSANKSGEYYGYARMISRIPEGDNDENDGQSTSDNPAIVQGIATGGRLSQDLLPKAIFTPATATAPMGRIIDDSARGTIFWEATEEELVDGDVAGYKPDETDELLAGTKSWGKPFNVQWISTTKLPFYKTRGLRNSWNSNREVKIARDGTAVEETVGKRLLQMFHHRWTSGELINQLSDSSTSHQ
ncbi:YT521-B-like domain-containing protein [Terfezia claveryi]|nr:YT521-B-like domain-containing protein [Terfezia claveryi]